MTSNRKRHFYTCKCECGKIKDVDDFSLEKGKSLSCGCLRKELATKHGMSYSKEFAIYYGIRERCYNTKRRDYNFYGRLGIEMSESWKESFENFLSDMGLMPSENSSIERIDHKGDYCKGNCVWTEDLSLQSYNQGRKKTNTSGRTGISFADGKWHAYIGYKGKTISLGYFNDLNKAISVREEAELVYYGFNKE